ncbi:MAG: 16S rRNA (cytidine(1402)-2'-O)-methyltransferase [Puniceicoccales bacterium]|jgi:16S rRNA (cytidine1402-2'-O)-methyltransferase|nr:16S rRNA (cytidine(1402)-2'-O)-methyltransferase [Puniceicoccales bacterium]
MAAGILYVVATPIGHLGDLSLRALEVLKSCEVLACEDSRVSSRLLTRYKLSRPLRLYNAAHEIRHTALLLKKLRLGKNVALISDAGTPNLSDPGFRLVRACRKEGIAVLPVPGASAAVAALSVSGLPSDSFLFLGFLPPKSRREVFLRYDDCPHTLIFYEACHRIERFLSEAREIWGDGRWACVAREMTKLHETYITRPLGEICEEKLYLPARGEFTVLVANARFRL